MSVSRINRHYYLVFLLLVTCFMFYQLIHQMSLSKGHHSIALQNLLHFYKTWAYKNSSSSSGHRVTTSEEEFRWRLHKLDNFCSSSDHKNDLPGNVLNILTNQKFGFIYCVIPKSGCTFWKRIFILLMNKNSSNELKSIYSIPRHMVHATGSLPVTYNATNHSPRLYPLRLLVARDPFPRILSSYLDKIYLPDFWHVSGVKFMSMFKHKSHLNEATEDNVAIGSTGISNLDFMEKHFQEIRLKFPRSHNWKRENGSASCGNYVTFSQFVMAAMFDEEPHWMTSYDLCDPCQFQPTHIVNMRSFTEDAKAILNLIGLDNLVHDLDRNTQVNEEMTMLIDYHFSQVFQSDKRHFYKHCITAQELAYRLWQTFIWKGYLHPYTQYNVPQTSNVEAVKQDLIHQVHSSRVKGLRDSHLLKKSKKAFDWLFRSTLSNGVYQQFLLKHRHDFKMFEVNNGNK